jgi:hypothetical protein
VDHPLIDLRLFKNRVVTLANSAMFLFCAGFFGVAMLFPRPALVANSARY